MGGWALRYDGRMARRSDDSMDHPLDPDSAPGEPLTTVLPESSPEPGDVPDADRKTHWMRIHSRY